MKIHQFSVGTTMQSPPKCSGTCNQIFQGFPMHMSDILLPQDVIILNMLRTSGINPKLLDSTHLDGQYDYNRAPISPPGAISISHETPNRRRTWAPHGQD
jgi:hypothetical protein